MDVLAVGNTVTIKVRNLYWGSCYSDVKYLVIPEFIEYTGTIVRQHWQEPSEISITSGIPHFPVRRIQRERIVEVNGANVDYSPTKSPRKVISVQGSKGRTYVVTKENDKVSCSCPGWSYRKSCKHQAVFD